MFLLLINPSPIASLVVLGNLPIPEGARRSRFSSARPLTFPYSAYALYKHPACSPASIKAKSSNPFNRGVQAFAAKLLVKIFISKFSYGACMSPILNPPSLHWEWGKSITSSSLSLCLVGDKGRSVN